MGKRFTIIRGCEMSEKENINQKEIFEKIVSDKTDKVKIYSVGSCDYNTRIGKYYTLLEYKTYYKVINDQLCNTTVNRCIIQGIIDAIKLLKKPCNLLIVTATPVGIKTAMKSSKGPNVDLIKTLFDLIEDKKCEFEFVAIEGEGKELREYILNKNEKSV